jgi:hypothetical protein
VGAYALIKTYWGTVSLADAAFAEYMVMYRCKSNYLEFLDEGIDTDQIDIYTRSGSPPTAS